MSPVNASTFNTNCSPCSVIRSAEFTTWIAFSVETAAADSFSASQFRAFTACRAVGKINCSQAISCPGAPHSVWFFNTKLSVKTNSSFGKLLSTLSKASSITLVSPGATSNDSLRTRVTSTIPLRAIVYVQSYAFKFVNKNWFVTLT
ncbi:hypothetical protein D3C85_1223080 [compost metagenome]